MAIDERRLIEDLLTPLTEGAPGAFGLRDDAALLTPDPGTEHIVTIDTVVSGVHYRARDPADLVARKALRVNISDLVAKASEPFAWFLSLALPRDSDEAWPRDFASGLAADQKEYGIRLYGGDTVRTTGPMVISVTMIGHCPEGASVRRFGARPGDCLFVSGTIGDGALGLVAGEGKGLEGLSAQENLWLAGRFHLPRPPVGIVAALQAHARAAMDISDGPVNDLGLMCAASGVGAEVAIVDVPLSDPAKTALDADPRRLETILAGGDDFEVLAAVPPGEADAFAQTAADAGVVMTRIGLITEGREVIFRDGAGEPVDLPQTTFRHF